MSAPGSAAAAPVARAAKVAPALRGDLMWTPIMLATAHAAVLASAYAPLSAAFLARATEGRVLFSLPLTIVAVVGYMLAVGAALLWAPRPAAAAADGKQPPREAPREPEGTREAMFVYNVYMTLLSAVMCVLQNGAAAAPRARRAGAGPASGRRRASAGRQHAPPPAPVRADGTKYCIATAPAFFPSLQVWHHLVRIRAH